MLLYGRNQHKIVKIKFLLLKNFKNKTKKKNAGKNKRLPCPKCNSVIKTESQQQMLLIHKAEERDTKEPHIWGSEILLVRLRRLHTG